MNDTAENLAEPKSGFPPMRLAFEAVELRPCDECGRQNPPNRQYCLYCGTEINPDGGAVPSAFPAKAPEPWENGFNLILRAAALKRDDHEIAKILSLDHEDITTIIDSMCPLPLARLASGSAAARVCSELSKHGLECSIVSDNDLFLLKPNIRIGSISMSSDRIDLIDFNTALPHRFAVADVSILVTGSLRREQTNSFSKQNPKRAGMSREALLSFDEQVMDIYVADDNIGFRIQTAGFDFSCLREKKSLLAKHNWPELVELLQRTCSRSRLVADYDRVRSRLNSIWPLESHHETHGRKNTGFGKREFGTSVSTNNLDQFNRFSRLQRHLDER